MGITVHRCCCWMWMATVCSLREHRLLLHRRRSPWRSSRFCVQARRKGNVFTSKFVRTSYQNHQFYNLISASSWNWMRPRRAFGVGWLEERACRRPFCSGSPWELIGTKRYLLIKPHFSFPFCTKVLLMKNEVLNYLLSEDSCLFTIQYKSSISWFRSFLGVNADDNWSQIRR